jgi:putative ABC transport system substrate-binding protein
MRRRDFITLLGGAAACWPLAARAQQPGMPVVGFLHSQSPHNYGAVLAGFHEGLKDAGLSEGRNIALDYRWANDQSELLPALAADLVRRRVAVIVAGGGTEATLAAKSATTEIPIVVVTGSDPVAVGLVASLNRPGGNITGVTFVTSRLASKRLDLLRQLVPSATTIGYLSDPRFPNSAQETDEVLAAARGLGSQIALVESRGESDFEAAFASLTLHRADALLIGAFPVFTSHRDKLVALAARHKIPAMYSNRDYAVEGGLISFGASQAVAFRLGGTYVGRILKGEKPADLPVQQSVRFELVINQTAAKLIGLDVPDKLLALADEVIE